MIFKKYIILKTFLTILLLLFFCDCLYSIQDTSDFSYKDKIRIREAIKIFGECGDSIWNSWSAAPFALLLVTNENEYLINHSNPTEDFRSLGYDSILKHEVFSRPRQFGISMLATFPAVNGVLTIVVGLPENTGLKSWDWIVTVLHEHFHQLQMSRSDYYTSIDSLDLAGDDNSGMWMLNYKFPYNDKVVSEQYKILIQSAKKTYLSINEADFESNLENYLSEREKFKSLLKKKDYDYFSFQTWQEGLARYTEIKIADCLKNNYVPSDEAARLNDYISLDSFDTKIKNKLLVSADSQSLPEDERICFYTLGALEGLILDKVNPDWKDLYFEEKFYTEKYFN